MSMMMIVVLIILANCLLYAYRACGEFYGRQIDITTQTDQSINREQQQAEMLIDYGPYTVSNPQQQIKTVVLPKP